MWTFAEALPLEGIFEEPFKWQQKLPSWLRSKHIASLKTVEEFAKHFEDDHLFIGDGDEMGDVLVIGTPIAQETIEGHLFAKKGSDPDLVQATIMYAGKWLFNYTDTKRILSIVRSRHRGLKMVMYKAGYKKTGYRMWDSSAEDGQVFEGDWFILEKK